MTVKTGQVWAGIFPTVDATGALSAGAPAGVLYVDGVADGAVVTITGANPYKFSVILPALTAGQRVQMYITATIAGIATAGVVASEQADTALVGESATSVIELLYSIMGGEGWTDETLVSIQAAIEAISSIDEAGVRNAIGLATANLDTQLAGIPKGTTVYDGKTLTELIKLISAVLLGKLSGGGTGQLAFRDMADTKDRVITDIDLATGDRTTQTLDGA